MSGLLYTDESSGYKVLCLEKKNRVLYGACFHPLIVRSLVPWSSDCRHCQSHQRHYHLPLAVRRHVEMLASIRRKGGEDDVLELRVPSLQEEHTIRTWRRDSYTFIVVTNLKRQKMKVEKKVAEAVSYSEDVEAFQHLHIVPRAVRFLLSVRSATSNEIAACARPLLSEQIARNSRPGYRKGCDKIDWQEVLEGLTGR